MWRGGRLVMEANENSPTRQRCFDVLRTQLRTLVAEGSSVLVGFDFPFGYPAGFTAALGLGGQRPWRAVWDELAARIRDNQAGGTNDRFQVASDLNLRVGVSEGPFWGRPQTLNVVERDATDNRILECAVAAGAEVVISGDSDLLSMQVFRNIEIRKLSDFLFLYPKLPR